MWNNRPYDVSVELLTLESAHVGAYNAFLFLALSKSLHPGRFMDLCENTLSCKNEKSN